MSIENALVIFVMLNAKLRRGEELTEQQKKIYHQATEILEEECAAVIRHRTFIMEEDNK